MLNALAWLLVGYSDGLVYLLMEKTGISGYVLYILPIFLTYIIFLFTNYKLVVSQTLLRRQFFIISLFLLTAVLHYLTIGGFYMLGYAQIMIMMAMTFLIRDLFTTNETTLRPGFAKGLLAIHYILCGYAMLSWLVLHGADIDISLFVSEQESLYVFSVVRTSGLQREPAWAGYALASTYLAVLATRPQRMLLVQLAFLGGIAATGSGVGFILASLFITYQMLTTGKGGLGVRLIFLGGMAVVVATVFSDRIGNVLDQNDPSTQMRLESSFVALDVIAETFPVGSGFGNYQEHADFDPVIWSGFLDTDEATYYKSDTLILNIIAELGVFGCVLLIAFIGNFICRTAPLVSAMALVMMLSSGTMIMPFYLVLAAICGLERGRVARLAAGQKEART